MQLRITHETRYDYRPPVETAQHLVCLRPVNTACQDLQDFALDVEPLPASRRDGRDVFGNHRSFLSLQTPHSVLRVAARSQVDTRPPAAGDSTLPWEVVRERFRYRAGAPWDAAAEFIFASHHVPRHEDFATYARPSFPPGRALQEAARELMARIHADFRYEPRSTEVNTPALEALTRRRGVCQDFAHVLVACLRALGLAARYVSGYLLTVPPPGQPRLIGSDASHAWAAVYLPDLADDPAGHGGWHDLDPTNARDGLGTPGEDYVRVAVGRDYADVSPMRGVIHGGASHTLTVGVTVEPFAATPSSPAPQPPHEDFP